MPSPELIPHPAGMVLARIEQALRARAGEATTAIHGEPEHKAKHSKAVLWPVPDRDAQPLAARSAGDPGRRVPAVPVK